jgi:hypothetical protein
MYPNRLDGTNLDLDDIREALTCHDYKARYVPKQAIPKRLVQPIGNEMTQVPPLRHVLP